MRKGVLQTLGVAGTTIAVAALLRLAPMAAADQAQTPPGGAASGAQIRTEWGEPDLCRGATGGAVA